RLWPASLLLLGLLLGFVPLAAALLRGLAGSPPGGAPAVPVDPARLALAVAAGLVAAVAAGVVAPDPMLGLAVGGYTAVVLLAFGLGALATNRARNGPPAERARFPMFALVAGLAAYAAAMVVVPIQTGLTWVAPSPARLLP